MESIDVYEVSFPLVNLVTTNFYISRLLSEIFKHDAQVSPVARILERQNEHIQNMKKRTQDLKSIIDTKSS